MYKAGSLLAPILKNLGIEENVRLAQIKDSWNDLFSKPLSTHMSPSKLTEAELLINVDSPIWMQQLSFCKKDIIGKLDAYGVKNVRFRIGKVLHKKQPLRARKKNAALSAEEHLFMEEVLSSVDDEQLKASIKKALSKSLSSGSPRS